MKLHIPHQGIIEYVQDVREIIKHSNTARDVTEYIDKYTSIKLHANKYNVNFRHWLVSTMYIADNQKRLYYKKYKKYLNDPIYYELLGDLKYNEFQIIKYNKNSGTIFNPNYWVYVARVEVIEKNSSFTPLHTTNNGYLKMDIWI